MPDISASQINDALNKLKDPEKLQKEYNDYLASHSNDKGQFMYAPYAFDPTISFGDEQGWLDRYGAALPGQPANAPDLTKDLINAGTYKGFDWAGAGKELMDQYQPPDYVPSDYVKAPTYQKTQYQGAGPYEKTQFDFNEQYNPPAEYQAFDFTQPNVDEIEKVQPLADSVWNAKKQDAFDAIDNRYDDIAQRTRDELIRTGKRPEQAAAVMQNLDIEREKAKREESRKIDISQADQTVGIAQKEQELGLQRGLAVAGMDADTQERMAAELSKKYGYDIEDARYIVENYAEQQQAQAGENKTAYDAAAEEDRYKYEADRGENQAAYDAAAKEAAREYEAKTAESKYGYESGTEAERYNTGLEQWFKEQQAAEAEKEYQSKYGAAQDITQAKDTQFKNQQGANTDYWNAVMQGAQQAGTSAAQQGTYWTNLEPGERKDQMTQAKLYNYGPKGGPNPQAPSNPQTPQPPKTVKPTYKTQQAGEEGLTVVQKTPSQTPPPQPTTANQPKPAAQKPQIPKLPKIKY